MSPQLTIEIILEDLSSFTAETSRYNADIASNV